MDTNNNQKISSSVPGGVENKENKENKENNKQQKSQRKSIRKSVSGTKIAKSPRKKLKKKSSLDKTTQSSEQRSETKSFMEISENADEDKLVSLRTIVSSQTNNKIYTPPEAPPTHYILVTVEVEQRKWAEFMDTVTVNRNLVVTKVGRSLMSHFMPGDQISNINGITIWNIDELQTEFSNSKTDEDPKAASVTVIRVWNVNCVTNEQLVKLEKFGEAPLEDRLHYFSIRLHGAGGMRLCSDKQRVLVQHIRAKTAVSSVLLAGDQILAVGDYMVPIAKKTDIKSLGKMASEEIRGYIKKQGFVDITACRLVGARSSPAPSLDAELAEKFPGYAVGVERGTQLEKKPDETISLPLEADALEIALREMTFLKQWVGEDGFDVPPCDKGPTMIMDEDPTENGTVVPPTPVVPPASSGASGASGAKLSQSTSNTQISTVTVTPSKSDTSIAQNSVADKSVYLPTSATAAAAMTSTPISGTPRKRGIFGGETYITIVDQPETTKMTSDIPEEKELEKPTARSGIVAYIKAKLT